MGRPEPPHPVSIQPVHRSAAGMSHLPVPSTSMIRTSPPSTPQRPRSTPLLGEVVSEAMASTHDVSFNLSHLLDPDEHSALVITTQSSKTSDTDVEVVDN